MNLLREGVEMGAVVPTNLSRKLTIDGITDVYTVYKVRLDLLFYNDQNDRIVTWISQYRAEHDGLLPDHREDQAAYNEIIEDFIIRSNPDSIRATQANIELVDQREPGVVLTDGRVIDGNRRFTCLRRLALKNPRFNHFETVILDRNIENSAKQIKMLELSIQHGEESRVEYNTIDRLVGIYQDIEEDGLLTAAEYARSTNEPEGEIHKRVEQARLMVEFLAFINAPKQYHIARDLQMYSTLEELVKLMKKCKTPDEAEDLKNCMFANILMKPAADMTRFVRNVRSVIASEYLDSFLEEQKEIASRVIHALPPKGHMNERTIREVVRANDTIVEEMERSMEKAVTKAKRTETRNRPSQLIEKSTTFLESIDTNLFAKLHDSELRRIERQLDRLQEVVQALRGQLDA